MWVRRVWRRVPSLNPPRLRSLFFRTQTNSLFSARTQTLAPTQTRVWKIYLLVLEVLAYGEGGEVK